MIIKNKRKWRLTGLILVLAVSLYACSDESHLRDLHRYIDHVKKSLVQRKIKNDILAALHVPKPAQFQASKQRDPFESEQASSSGQVSNDPLTAFPSTAFEFLGTVSREGKVWAIIQAPDTKVYQVTINNRFGMHYGKIIAIYPDHIEVEEEISPQETGETGQAKGKRIVTLRIKGES